MNGNGDQKGESPEIVPADGNLASIVNGNFGTFPLEKGRPSDESAT
jgi:hypothetical protein